LYNIYAIIGAQNMLTDQLRIVLGSSYVFQFKALTFHWNVVGPNFHQYHAFFGALYDEVEGAIDRLAESIRLLDEMSPGSLSELLKLSVIKEHSGPANPASMFQELLDDNDAILRALMEAYEVADEEEQEGHANMLAERMEAHQKHGWMLRSLLK